MTGAFLGAAVLPRKTPRTPEGHLAVLLLWRGSRELRRRELAGMNMQNGQGDIFLVFPAIDAVERIREI